tara:strand:+ start:279 stop:587 length:309 start_codon:yes stop_codon:yes gene_type:complete
MLINHQKRLKIQDIIRRICLDKKISLKERILVEKYAQHSSTISNWLRKAVNIRRNGEENPESLSGLIQSLGLNGLDKENHFDPDRGDLSDWFGDAPDWLKRS